MPEPIIGWDDFAQTSPAADALKKPGSGHVMSKLGFMIDDVGFPVPAASMSDAKIAELRQSFGIPDWQPVMAGDVLPGAFTVNDIALRVHGLAVVDHEEYPTSRATFRITRDFMYGSAYQGLGIVWRNDAWSETKLGKLGEPGGTTRLWRWPLSDIESITVVREHKRFKLRDEQVRITGRTPGPGAKGERAGVSLNDFLGGADPSDVTHVAPSSMRFGGLNETDAIQPSDGSLFLGFGEHLARLVAAARRGSARWTVDVRGKAKTHVAWFG
jgi:hypothetical protein